jgi:hypothetical protein
MQKPGFICDAVELSSSTVLRTAWLLGLSAVTGVI